MIPPFQARGNLPPGKHRATWAEVVARFGTNDHRTRLLAGLRKGLDDLRSAGCTRVFLDGSFVTGKEFPADYDVCWEMSGVDVKHLDRVFLQFQNHRAAQKARYFGEFLPTIMLASSRDTFLEFFQRDGDGHRKGIVVLDLRRLE